MAEIGLQRAGMAMCDLPGWRLARPLNGGEALGTR
jgi:hypothetical protein